MRASGPIVAACVLVAACGVLTPDDIPVQPAIVMSTPPGVAGALVDVDRVSLRVTTPAGTVRDTVLRARIAGGRIRARAILRPQEGELGTGVGVTLSDGNVALFRGHTRLGPDTGWPFEAQVDAEPVAVIDVEYPPQVVEGETITLADYRPILFDNGRRITTAEVDWTSLAPEIAEIQGESLIGRAPGVAPIVVAWRDLADTVTAYVWSMISIDSTEVSYYLGPDDVVGDSIDFFWGTGGPHPVSVSVEQGSDWLTAAADLRDEGPNQLEFQIDGAQLPLGASVGRVVLTSPGFTPATVTVQVFRDPADAEVRSWDRFCLLDDRDPPGSRSARGCIYLRVKTWPDGDGRRVVVEVRNLHGAPEGGTAERFELNGFGIDAGLEPGTAEMIGFGRIGPVDGGIIPRFRLDAYGRLAVSVDRPRDAAIIGCATFPFHAQSSYITCEETGASGRVRLDLRTTSTDWSLAEARGYMRVWLEDAQGECTETPDACEVR